MSLALATKRRPSVLLADDHPTMLSTVSGMLASHFDVLAAVNDGKAALEVASHKAPDLAVLDIRMTGLDGIRTARELKQRDPDAKIAFLTGQEDDDYVSEALAAGATGYIVKRRMQSDLLFGLHQLDGTLDISSRGHGTTLKAVIPVEAAQEHFTASLPEPPAPARVVPANPSNRRRILIVDDHDVMRRGIRGLLENEVDLEICGEAADGLEAVQKTRELHPDLIILDLNMPNFGGMFAVSQLRRHGLSTKILVFTMHELAAMESSLRSVGCKGCVLKVHGERDLLRGVRTVLEGGEFFNSQAARTQTV